MNLLSLDLLRKVKAMAMDGNANTLSPDERVELLQAIKDLQRAENVGDGFVSRSMMRCSPTLWSQIKNHKYLGNGDKYLLRAREWMLRHAERSDEPEVGYVNTSIGRDVMKICHRAWSMPSIGEILAPSGAGKTTALQEYRRRNPERTVLIQAGEAFRTKRGILRALAEALGAHPRANASAPQLYAEVRDHIAELYADGKGDPVLAIVDEATTLEASALNILRNLHDDPKCRLALVLADTWRLDVELHRPSGIAGGYEQLRSRLGAVYRLGSFAAGSGDGEIPLGDVKAVAASVLESLGHDVRLMADAAHFLHRLAQKDGKLRNVVHRLRAVSDVAEQAGCEATFTVAQLDIVADLVGGKCEQEYSEENNPFAAQAGRSREASAKVA
jgi:hypothetical protein